ncbi:MAG: sulfurtransferase [Armatimonadota bacterium]|nr:sulfurtransferase [Armatimonadota bacterium]
MTPPQNEEAIRHLVSTGWLYDHLEDPHIRVVDVRGKVVSRTVEPGVQKAEYRGVPEAFAASHIPGAAYVDWTVDIVEPFDPLAAQIAPPARFAEAMAVRGIGNDTLVVAYDDHPSSQFATRLWWALRYYGHTQVCVLDGGWAAWLAEGRPTTTEVSQPERAAFTSHIEPHWRAAAEDVLKGLQAPHHALVDARDEEQYTGAIRRGPRGGHIPGAIHLPRESLFTPDGRFLPPADLQRVVDAAGLEPGEPVTAYCNGGVAATSLLFALDMLGFKRLANYDGSWNEWTERPDLPVETGGKPWKS